MNIKLIALGNVLMRDDGIAIALAKEMEYELNRLHIEVIYGETDIGYSVSMAKDADYLFVLDASYFGGTPGELKVIPITDYSTPKLIRSPHSFSFLDLLAISNHKTKGLILMVEIAEVAFGFELSTVLNDQVKVIAEKVLKLIEGELMSIASV